MHRFRKKSDAKRSVVLGLDFHHPSQSSELGDPSVFSSAPRHGPAVAASPERNPSTGLAVLPPESDFRTSLILPELARRFTLLRTTSGEAVLLGDLKSKFAEQRARGAENQITEQEEDILLETLLTMRSAGGQGKPKGDSSDVEEGQADFVDSGDQASISQQSIRSPFLLGSPSSSTRSTKRYSNNLFVSGRFRDHGYMRGMTQWSTKSATSIAPTEESPGEDSALYSDSARPVTPESGITSSVQSTPERHISVRSAPVIVPYGSQSNPAFVAEYRLSKALGPAGFKRASLAVEDAIKEMSLIEEEADDEIVMPRTAPAQRLNFRQEQKRQTGSLIETPVQAGTAISSDKEVIMGPDSRETSPVPNRRSGTLPLSPRLPGYIPGMPRPMTPRDTVSDFDEHISRANSTTPRASSPITDRSSLAHSPRTSSSAATPITHSIDTGSTRRDFDTPPSRRPSPLYSLPLYLSRSTNGRFASAEDYNGSSLSKSENGFSYPMPGNRRRPASPLSESTFQPMAVSSQPSAPSNVTWNSLPITTRPQTQDTKSRQEGMTNGQDRTVHPRPLEPNKFPSHFSGSSPNPDPLLNVETDRILDQSSSAMSRADFDAIQIRSPTPSLSVPHSPTSATLSNFQFPSSIPSGSRRSSKHNGSISPFALNSSPLVLSPGANSSRSSLESAGSSYHSWEAGYQKDRGIDVFINDNGSPESLWHSIADDEPRNFSPTDATKFEKDPESVIERYAGLTKSDFLAIQEKLVGAAIGKATTPLPRDRVPSLRRRRPSTSQSNYSVNGIDVNRVTSPPPQTQNVVASDTRPTRTNNISKANALLDSVVDSIQTPPERSQVHETNEGTPRVSQSDIEFSNSARRNRDLADILFGAQEQDIRIPSPEFPPQVPQVMVEEPGPLQQDHSNPPDVVTQSSSIITSPSLLRTPTTPKTPQSPRSQVELTKEVQLKTDAAMAQLKRSTLPDRHGVGGSITRKRSVNPNQISNPQLVSATTSVDTIPLQQSSDAPGQQASKIGMRIRRLRETLLPKPALPDSGAVTPYPINPIDPQSPPSGQVARFDQQNLHPSTSSSVGASDTHQVPSTPASAGPGLRGFMARFRKQRLTSLSPEYNPSLSTSSSPHGTSTPEQIFSAPATRESFETSSKVQIRPRPPRFLPPKIQRSDTGARNVPVVNEDNDEYQRRKLFEAASNLGLDHSALNDLLSRSSSVNSTSAKAKLSPQSGLENGVGRSKSLTVPSRHFGAGGVPQKAEEASVRKSYRVRGDHGRPLPLGQTDVVDNTIVRRTLIFPSDTPSNSDLDILMRKSSSARRRRSGSGSVTSGRSVHDRAPTPPPPRSPTAKRFSENLPPVPQLPPSLSTLSENTLHPSSPSTPTASTEKPGSAYDSLYDMYAGESKPVSSFANDSNGHGVALSSSSIRSDNMSESGPVVEVIELANGETIWSIVNGLRDDDIESAYASRASFASEYSSPELKREGLQLLIKEHGRTGSKGSNASGVSSRAQQGNFRPETKVYYSTPAEIGRLIENISHNMEAGSFNLLPATSTSSHSNTASMHSGSEMHWTMEERVDHMIGSLRPP